MKKIICILSILLFQPIFAQDGSLDTTFSVGLGIDSDVLLIKEMSDGKILLGGSFTSYNGFIANGIALLNSDGSFNSTYNSTIGEYFRISSALIESDGKIVLGGEFSSYNGIPRNCLIRIYPDGTIDSSFFITISGGGSTISSISKQNNKYIISGKFGAVNGYYNNCLARINYDGTSDLSFNTNGIYAPGSSAGISKSIVLPDGKILITGFFESYQYVNRKNIARLNADGTLDITFDPGSGASSVVTTATAMDDGKYMIGGNFSNYNGVNKFLIARINHDGSLDASFGIDTNYNIMPSTILIQPDNKVIVAGNTSSINTDTKFITRLNTNGTTDSSFSTGINFDNQVVRISFQSDGKILAGGWFNSYNGVNRKRLLRLNNTSQLAVNTNIVSLNIYPNPTRDKFNIDFKNANLFIKSVTVFDLVGNELMMDETQGYAQEKQIDLTSFEAGLYYIRVITDNGTISQKIIKY